MSNDVQGVIDRANLFSDDQLYKFIKLPANAIIVAAGIVAEAGIPYIALIVDKDEVTLMLPEDVLEQFNRRLVDAEVSKINYRLITFDIVLEPSLVGFMARISTALADVNISIMPFAAYSRDHIFVPAEQYDTAITTLQRIQSTQ